MDPAGLVWGKTTGPPSGRPRCFCLVARGIPARQNRFTNTTGILCRTNVIRAYRKRCRPILGRRFCPLYPPQCVLSIKTT